ncbi:MAG: 6-phosphogluconolactonase [Elusimicrobia bacterium]|nr:6-phosphogluconolactonase [Elusimicrobiota bacterium]
MAEAAAELWAQQARTASGSRGVFRVALSGGRTPELLFGLLTEERFQSLPWEKTEVFWVDERYVPYDDQESNYRLARESLLDRVPILKESIHPMPTGSGDPARDAAAYEALLRGRFPGQSWPSFDLCLLGLGEDGHTASLFPGGPELAERHGWVAASRSPKGVADRLTLTMPVLLGSRLRLLLACGRGKSAVVKAVLGPVADPPLLPAQMVWHGEGRGVFLIDQEAACRVAPTSQ